VLRIRPTDLIAVGLVPHLRDVAPRGLSDRHTERWVMPLQSCWEVGIYSVL
jgi:hypothetical protein